MLLYKEAKPNHTVKCGFTVSVKILI